MHTENLHNWQHTHVLGQDQKRPGERRTLVVIVITGAMMIIEIATGILFGSMALLADSLHMASHAVALGIVCFFIQNILPRLRVPHATHLLL